MRQLNNKKSPVISTFALRDSSLRYDSNPLETLRISFDDSIQSLLLWAEYANGIINKYLLCSDLKMQIAYARIFIYEVPMFQAIQVRVPFCVDWWRHTNRSRTHFCVLNC